MAHVIATSAPPKDLLKVINLWCKEDNHDKLYRLEICSNPTGGMDVFCFYGRRGGKMTMHIKCEGASYSHAAHLFESLVWEKKRKGYAEITEDVLAVGKTTPTRRQ